MGRKVMLSAVVAAGLVQVAPASAQSQDQDKVAVAPPVAKAAPASPNDVHDKARELAENDLASAPPEELKPVLVDPSEGRRALLRARRAAAEAQKAQQARIEKAEAARRAEAEKPAEPAAVPAPVVAAAAPAPKPVAAPVAAPVERIAETAPVPAAPEPAPVREAAAAPIERVASAEPAPIPAVAPAVDAPQPERIAERRADPAPQDQEDDPQPVYAADDQDEPAVEVADASESEDVQDAPLPPSQPRDLRERPSRAVYADDDADAPLPRDQRERPARQVYADDDGLDAAPPAVRDAPARPSRPVYADDDRDADPAYPSRDGGFRTRGPRYAIVNPNLRPDLRRDGDDDQPWANRAADPACDGDRGDRLLAMVRRKADFERIDGRAADDLEDEIGNAASLQRSYCASGMNDWREQRLDRLYAQIEDRIRYEEDRRWRR